MKLFLNSFHIDHYQAMFVTPLYDSPGSWSKNPPVSATTYLKAFRSSTLSSVQFPWMLSFCKTTPGFQFGLAFPCVLGTQPFSATGMCSEETNCFPLSAFSQTCHLADMQVIPMCGDSPSFSIAFNRSNIYYPRVSISGTYDLREILKGLGVTDGFINHADLSGIAGKVIL